MKTFMIIACVLALSSCTSEGTPPPHAGDPSLMITGAGWRASECSELCLVDLTIDGRNVAVVWRNPPIDQRPERSARGRLTPSGLDRRSRIEDQLAPEHPSESLAPSCIDCVEQYLTARRGAAETTYHYDYANRPPPLSRADRFVHGLIIALIRCRPNPNIRVLGERCASPSG